MSNQPLGSVIFQPFITWGIHNFILRPGTYTIICTTTASFNKSCMKRTVQKPKRTGNALLFLCVAVRSEVLLKNIVAHVFKNAGQQFSNL